jgi:hypothetical protein
MELGIILQDLREDMASSICKKKLNKAAVIWNDRIYLQN